MVLTVNVKRLSRAVNVRDDSKDSDNVQLPSRNTCERSSQRPRSEQPGECGKTSPLVVDTGTRAGDGDEERRAGKRSSKRESYRDREERGRLQEMEKQEEGARGTGGVLE